MRFSKNLLPVVCLISIMTIPFIVLSLHASEQADNDSRIISGLVVDAESRAPIADALVRVQTTRFMTHTDAEGRFEIAVEGDLPETVKKITGWKEGYYNWGAELKSDAGEHLIELTKIPPYKSLDNYEWESAFPPANPDEQDTGVPACKKCHPEIVDEWSNNAHGKSAVNPIFLAFYNGVETDHLPGKSIGYRKDYPNSFGNCATCHVPGMGYRKIFDSDINQAQGVDREGVLCDVCHKIDKVKLDDYGGFPGTLSMTLVKPGAHQVFFGSIDDVVSVDESAYHPLYKESVYCAPCHHGTFYDIRVYPEFEEWANSSYAENGITCQKCHMPPTGKIDHFAPLEKGAAIRDPMSIPSHLQLGVKDEKFMRDSIGVEVEGEIEDALLTVSATISNISAGHHYPTGSPMRNMVLVVRAIDGEGNALEQVAGETVPDWGGIGDVEQGNYAGLPGKGFSRTFVDRTSLDYLLSGDEKQKFPVMYPAPYWRPVHLFSDTRIPANGSDTTEYSFELPDRNESGPIRVAVTLVFRRTYKTWLDSMELSSPDLILHEEELTIDVQ